MGTQMRALSLIFTLLISTSAMADSAKRTVCIVSQGVFTQHVSIELTGWMKDKGYTSQNFIPEFAQPMKVVALSPKGFPMTLDDGSTVEAGATSDAALSAAGIYKIVWKKKDKSMVAGTCAGDLTP